MAIQGDHGRRDQRRARTAVERTALCVLRADLPRLRTILDVYARCMAEMMAELSATDDVAMRRLGLLAGLRQSHETALADLERVVGLLEAGGLAEPVAAATGGGAAVARAQDDTGTALRRGWRERGRRWCEPPRRKRSAEA